VADAGAVFCLAFGGACHCVNTAKGIEIKREENKDKKKRCNDKKKKNC